MACTEPTSFDYSGSSPNVVGHYKFQDNLLDSSGNSYHLTSSGTAQLYFNKTYPWTNNGLYFNGDYYLLLANASHNDAFRLTGDITALVVGIMQPEPSRNAYVVSFDNGNSSNSDDNFLYSWTHQQISVGNLNYLHEYDLDQKVFIDAPTVDTRLMVYAVRRQSNIVTIHDKYGQFFQSSTVTAPNGGSNSIFKIGFDLSSNHFRGFLQEIMIISGALSNVQITEQLGNMNPFCNH